MHGLVKFVWFLAPTGINLSKCGFVNSRLQAALLDGFEPSHSAILEYGLPNDVVHLLEFSFGADGEGDVAAGRVRRRTLLHRVIFLVLVQLCRYGHMKNL